MNAILKEDIDNIYESVRNSGAWEGATIVITGCAGFLGYYFMNFFTIKSRNLGIKKLIGLDSFLLEEPKWLKNLASENSGLVELHKFDISKDNFSEITNFSDPTYVIHGASIASPTFYRKYPIETIDANIWGLRKLLDFFRTSSSLKGFLFFSSSEIYGDPEKNEIPTSEEYRGNVSCNGPRACYDESKRLGETLCYIYGNNFNMPVVVARPFNNYGPGMHINDKRLPADFAKMTLNNKDIEILSDGKPTRTFCYISDAITGYLLCLTHGKYDYFNIGIDSPEISVLELAEIYKKVSSELFNYSGEITYQKSDDPDYMVDNPNRRCPKIDKAVKILGYKPKVNVQQGVKRYLKFLKYDLNL